jgi:hypothetical protein
MVKAKYGEQLELKLGEPVMLPDDLTLSLREFTHKRPWIGGATKATATVALSKHQLTDIISLSVHGVEGKESEPDRFDTITWQGYQFQLKKFVYDSSIELIVVKTGEAD